MDISRDEAPFSEAPTQLASEYGAVTRMSESTQKYALIKEGELDCYPSGHRLSAPIFGMDETARRPARASAARGLRLAVAAFGTVVVVAVCSATWGKRAAAADHMMWLAWRGGPASQRAGVRGRRTPGAVSLKLLEPREPRTVCHFLVGLKPP